MYWDSKQSLPIDFPIHNEKVKNESYPYGMSKIDKRKQYNKKRVKESEVSNCIKELDKSKIEIMLRMLCSAICRCLSINYVMVDSWFNCNALIKTLRSEGIPLIGIYKIDKTKLMYYGMALTYSDIINRISKPKCCCSFNLFYERADVIFEGTHLSLFFNH